MTPPFILRKMDRRWIAAAMLIGFFLLLQVTALLLGKPVFELPPFLWFGPMAPYFADLRAVQEWSDQFLAHPGIRITDLRDAWDRPFNYPYAWLYAGNFGLNAHTVMAFGYGLGAMFFASALYAVGRLNVFGGLVSGLFLISYSVMFGLERANVDLLMFVLLALALALRRTPPLSALAIALAAALKLHPVFALFALLPPRKQNLPWIGLALLIAAAGLLVHSSDFLTAMSSAPNMQTGILSFGMTAAGLDFGERFHHPGFFGETLAVGAGMLILALGIGARARPAVDPALFNERDVYAFRLGAGIYLGAFMLGTNHDYRAIFLLFCLPLLFSFLKRRLAVGWTRATLLLILINVNWLYFAGESPWSLFLLKQAMSWALVICLTGLAVASLPESLQWPRLDRRVLPTPSRHPLGSQVLPAAN